MLTVTFVIPDVAGRVAFSDDKMHKISLFDTERCMIDLYCARPGQGQRPHVHEGEDKSFYVIQGRGEFQIGTETYALSAGAAAIAQAGVEHGLTNPGPEDLIVLVVIAPPIAH
jgi:quercetin dioxygenase-like cupin family protein